MFTGIVQNIATLGKITDHDGIRTFDISFPTGFCDELNIGASVSVDGTCLTVTEIKSDNQAKFDVILQSLRITTLSSFEAGDNVNVERAAKDGAEIGGHPLSGHVDFSAEIIDIADMDGNCRIRFGFDAKWGKYIFPKGYIAVNGCSLTIADVSKQDSYKSNYKESYFEVWLIPETRRVTTFGNKKVGGMVNIEIERSTQVVVDTIERSLEEKFGELYPVLEKLLADYDIDLNESLTNGLNNSNY